MVSENLSKNLIEGMPEQIFEVISNKGGYAHHLSTIVAVCVDKTMKKTLFS